MLLPLAVVLCLLSLASSSRGGIATSMSGSTAGSDGKSETVSDLVDPILAVSYSRRGAVLRLVGPLTVIR